ncbi:MAG: LuxR C-terminal-related transcriptional regulator [Alphaproteobacteria bacterium]
MAGSAATVRIVGSEALLVEGLKQFFEGAGFGVDPRSGRPAVPTALEAAAETNILIVLDDPSPGSGTHQLVEWMHEHHPEAKLVLLRPAFTGTQLVAALSLGFHAILLRSISQDALGHAVHMLLLDETLLPVSLAVQLIDREARLRGAGDQGRDGDGFSERDLRILGCLVHGKPNKMIAQEIGVSEATVKVQIRQLLKKIGASNRTQAAIWALGQGIGAKQGGEEGNGSVEAGTWPDPGREQRDC